MPAVLAEQAKYKQTPGNNGSKSVPTGVCSHNLLLMQDFYTLLFYFISLTLIAFCIPILWHYKLSLEAGSHFKGWKFCVIKSYGLVRVFPVHRKFVFLSIRHHAHQLRTGAAPNLLYLEPNLFKFLVHQNHWLTHDSIC